MSSVAPLAATELTRTEQESVERRAVFSSDLSVLSEIYQPDINLSVWNREINPELKGEAEALIALDPSFEKSLGMRADEAPAALQNFFRNTNMMRCVRTWLGLLTRFHTCLISEALAFGWLFSIKPCVQNFTSIRFLVA